MKGFDDFPIAFGIRIWMNPDMMSNCWMGYDAKGNCTICGMVGFKPLKTADGPVVEIRMGKSAYLKLTEELNKQGGMI